MPQAWPTLQRFRLCAGSLHWAQLGRCGALGGFGVWTAFDDGNVKTCHNLKPRDRSWSRWVQFKEGDWTTRSMISYDHLVVSVSFRIAFVLNHHQAAYDVFIHSLERPTFSVTATCKSGGSAAVVKCSGDGKPFILEGCSISGGLDLDLKLVFYNLIVGLLDFYPCKMSYLLCSSWTDISCPSRLHIQERRTVPFGK